MKFLNKSIVFIALLILLGCDDFGDMNENPNAPTSIENNPELLLTGLCKDPVNLTVVEAWDKGNLMAQYAARTVFTSFDQFEWGSPAGIWQQLYTSVSVAQSLYNIGVATENDSYQAVSLIMKSWMFQLLTDLWGEVPFTEAIKAKTDAIYAPAYDTQETIYKGILADLEKANTLLSVANPPKIKGDIIYNGDVTKWRKFANSLSLRVLMRLTNVESETDIDVAGGIQKIVSNATQYPLIETNADNAALTYTTTKPNVHPRTKEGSYVAGSFDEFRMSETVEAVLEAYDDPREKKWYNASSNSIAAGNPEWSGMINGMVDGDAYTYKGGPSNLSPFNSDFYNIPNLLRGIIMLCSEVKFLKAEAAVRYPSLAGVVNAKEAYDQGIALNFDYWGVAMPADYLQRTSGNTDVTAPVAFDGQLETIITQKWLALFYTDFQGFMEFKRTGFPKQIKPGPDALLPAYPSRFKYVTEEQALNKANYDAAVSRQGPDEYSTPVWWENK